MAVDVQNIWVGAASLYLRCDVPLSGAAPEFTDGAPDGGASVGATRHAAVRLSHEVVPLYSVAYISALDAVTVGAIAEITATLSETSLATLHDLLHSTTNTGALVTGGTTTELIAPIPGVCIVQPHPSGDGSLLYAMLYLAYQSDKVEWTNSRTAETAYSVTFRGLVDVTRPQGDNIYQLGIIPPPGDPIGVYGGGMSYGWAMYG